MVITGWKSISTTLGVSVDTAQRMRVLGLPVVNLTRRTVAAEPAALLAWVRQRAASCGNAALDEGMPHGAGSTS